MSFSKIYLSDNIEDPEDLAFVHQQIAKLGFDPVKEIPKTFAYSQVTEGFEIYHEVRENLEIDWKLKNQDVRASFNFRSIQHEYDSFRLVDIEARLFSISGDNLEKIAEKSFGETAGFPTKEQMIQQVIDLSEMLERGKSAKMANELSLLDRFILGGELRKLGFENIDKILNTTQPFLGDLRPGDSVPKLSEATLVILESSHFSNPIDYVFSAERLGDKNALRLTTILAYAEVDPNELHNYTKVYTKDYKISEGPFPMKAQMEKEVESLIIADRQNILQRLKEENTIPAHSRKRRV